MNPKTIALVADIRRAFKALDALRPGGSYSIDLAEAEREFISWAVLSEKPEPASAVPPDAAIEAEVAAELGSPEADRFTPEERRSLRVDLFKTYKARYEQMAAEAKGQVWDPIASKWVPPEAVSSRGVQLGALKT
jgi:hypothetical protein